MDGRRAVGLKYSDEAGATHSRFGCQLQDVWMYQQAFMEFCKCFQGSEDTHRPLSSSFLGITL